MKLSIVVPVYNEEANLHPLYERLQGVAGKDADEFEILFVDDCSTDRSLAIMQELCEKHAYVKYISLSRNFGHEVPAPPAWISSPLCLQTCR